MRYVLILFILCEIPLFSAEDKITISKIRFIVNDEIFNWESEKEIPLNLTKGGSQPNYIRTFIGFKPGDIITTSRLKKEVKKAQVRLTNSNLFYGVTISIIPPRKYPNRRTIVVKVTDGFRLRFGGGNAFGMFGIENLNGSGDSFVGELGINRLSFNYVNNTLFSHLFAGGGFTYTNTFPKDSLSNALHTGDISAFIGYRITPDLNIRLNTSVAYLPINNSIVLTTFTPSFIYYTRADFLDKITLEGSFFSKLDLTPVKESLELMAQGSITEKLIVGSNIVLALKLSSGKKGSVNVSYRLFNLFDSNRQDIRSGYPVKQLMVSSYISGHGELRFFMPPLFIPPLFNISPSLFIYTDYGLLDNKIKEALGVGARIYFDNPIFTGFTFSYGVNRDLQGRFIFAATLGF